jgi:hypothetical protein
MKKINENDLSYLTREGKNEKYFKPHCEVILMENEDSVLTASIPDVPGKEGAPELYDGE